MRTILSYYCLMLLGLLCLALICGCRPRPTQTLAQTERDTFVLRQTVHDTLLHTLPAQLVEVFRTDTFHHTDTIVRENARVRIERILLPGGTELVRVDCKADSLRAELIETQTQLAVHQKIAAALVAAKPSPDECRPLHSFLWGAGIATLLALLARPLWRLACARLPILRA